MSKNNINDKKAGGGFLLLVLIVLAIVFTKRNDGGLIKKWIGGSGYTAITTEIEEGDSVDRGYREFDELTKLDLELSSADVKIVQGDTFSVDYQLVDPTIQYVDGKLSIKDGSTLSVSFFGSFEDRYVTVTLPRKAKLEVDVDTTSGSVRVENVDIYGSIETSSGSVSVKKSRADGRLELDTTSGSVRLENCGYDKVSVNLSSGSCSIKDCELGDLVHDSTSGSLNIEDSSLVNLYSEASSGSARIALKAEEDEYNYKLTTTSGSIKVGNATAAKSYKKDNGALGNIDIDHTSGSIKIVFD